ncbi:MAG: PQQ-dependent sugar dehydrogenase, partial [Limisphaerales bacterium]
MPRRAAALLLALLLPSPAAMDASADPAATVTSTNIPAGATAAQARLRVAPGLAVELWAAEPLVQDVTSLAFDEHGRAYIVESGRRRTSVFDVRNLQPWLDDDFALRSVADRAAFLRERLTPGAPDYAAFLQAVAKSKFGDFNRDGLTNWHDLEVEQERIRLVWDADGDGRADTARTFADGFRTIVSGVAAGVLARGTNVWFTSIPDLWRFPAAPVVVQPADSGAVSPPAFSPSHPQAERLLTGFGVHVAFGGHDLHGLTFGPDGRLYFSIADRGLCVTNREGVVLNVPDTGAVLRCEPDGSQLEVFATGLRNPQELAFDDFGNLWTGDNNGDGGDKARWTLVLEGADYGWTIGWQWLPKMGAWNSERLWHTRESNSAAYLVPPVAHVGHGPAGIAHYPGTGLGDRFTNHFFYSDFPGGVRAFRVEPDGAFFKAADAGPWLEDNSATNFTGKLLWNLAPVDVAFPPGGGVVVADAFPSWEKTGGARLWRVFDPALKDDPAIAEVARLLREGMAKRSNDELARLLGHRDQRVRLEAQFELAGRGQDGWPVLERVAFKGTNTLARLHAIWGLGQIVRTGGPDVDLDRLLHLTKLLGEPEEHVRAAAVRLVCEARLGNAEPLVRKAMLDVSPRVSAEAILGFRHFFADAALRGRSSVLRKAYDALPAGLRKFLPEPRSHNLISIPYLELPAAVSEVHGGDVTVLHAVAALGGRLAEIEPDAGSLLRSFLHDPNSSNKINLRLGVVLGLRRSADASVSDFLNDSDSQIILEAARAIHDAGTSEFDPGGRPRPATLPLLAAMISPGRLERLVHRENLPFTLDEARAWILRRAVNANFRLGTPAHADALGGFAARTAADSQASALMHGVAIEALEALALWAQPPGRDRVTGLWRPLPPRDPQPARSALAAAWPAVAATNAAPAVLVAALRAAEALALPALDETLTRLAGHADAAVAAEVKRLLGRRAEEPAALAARLESGALRDQQAALAALAASTNAAADGIVLAWLNRLLSNAVPAPLQLDVFEAAQRRGGGGGGG